MADPSSAELKSLVARQQEELKTLNDVARLLRSTIDPQEIIRKLASYLQQTFPIAVCGILLIEQRKLHLIRFAPISQMDMTNTTRQILKSASEKVKRDLKEEEIALVLEDQFGASGTGPVGYLRSHVSVPLTFDGQVIGFLSVLSGQADALSREDVHGLEIIADQLRAALRNALLVEKLKSADQMKNELLSIFSHELRIPLTVIREGVSLLTDEALGSVNDEQKKFLGTVIQNVSRLQQLLDKVVTATEAITGNLRCAVTTAELNKVFEEVGSAFRSAAQAKGVTLDLPGGSPALRWVTDPERLKQALGYLAENAIQATPSGGRVTVSASANQTALELQVADTGGGIPAEELPRLFELFRAIGGIHERKTGGLGLGLFITKALTEALGGTIHVESTPGQGTRVSIRLPQRSPELPTSQKP